VRAWLSDSSRIGPQSEDDLRIIADAAKSSWLFENSHEVFEAIRDVRGMHMQAGATLSDILIEELPTRIQEIGEGETRLDLTFGQVWIVQVEELAGVSERRGYMEINRLLWDDRYT
jgi:hypothetical protein